MTPAPSLHAGTQTISSTRPVSSKKPHSFLDLRLFFPAPIASPHSLITPTENSLVHSRVSRVQLAVLISRALCLLCDYQLFFILCRLEAFDPGLFSDTPWEQTTLAIALEAFTGHRKHLFRLFIARAILQWLCRDSSASSKP